MNETEALKHILDTLCKKYDYIDKTTSILDHNDSKFTQLTNSQNRIARSILATVSLMRDPKKEIMFDRAAAAKHDVARLAKEIIEADQNGADNKRPLITYKDASDGTQFKKISRIEKTARKAGARGKF